MSVEALAKLLRGKRTLALTGAGVSTESGIPDYRGAGRKPSSTVQYQSFVRDPLTRRRYWARSLIGWPRIRSARPNRAHRGLAALEQHGLVSATVTQNVDGLHQLAGSENVIELHGALERVRCLECREIETRADLQDRLIALNPDWQTTAGSIAPDGDAEIPAEALGSFRVAECASCGGVLKPDVVFFGESVPRATVDAVYSLVEEADAMLVLGSSLTVFSGFRFVRKAAARGVPIAIANIGPTRGNPHASVRVDARLGAVFTELTELLGLGRLTEHGIFEESKAL